MEEISVKELIEVTDGLLLCGSLEQTINNIATDSRSLKRGDLFVPLIGERVDAHRFLEDCIAHCSVAFTSEHEDASESMKLSDCSVIRVEDTLDAMQKVTAYIRRKHPLPIVGVTGSVGKTTTREMIYTALSAEKKTFQTIKNYNSQVGVPLTMSRLTNEYEVGVLEMGMSNPGEMERLAYMVRPDMGVMTCIGVAHIEQLKTQDHICEEKMKIAKYMPDTGIMFLNGDDVILRAHAQDLSQKIIWYGLGADCDYRATDIVVDGAEQSFIVHGPNFEKTVKLQTLGEHNVRNALVAIAVANQYGVSLDGAIKALYGFAGQRQRIVKADAFTMIDDTYNASPDSMRAALKVLHDMPCEGRRIAVLADMLELGENTVAFHEQVGREVAENKIDELIVYGELAVHIAAAAGGEPVVCDSLEQITSYLRKYAKPEDLVLFKGSNGMHLANVVKEFE